MRSSQNGDSGWTVSSSPSHGQLGWSLLMWMTLAMPLCADDPLRGRGGEAFGPLTYEGQPLEHWSRIVLRELSTKTREPAYEALLEFARRDESREGAVVTLLAAVETETSATLLASAYKGLATAGTPAANRALRDALSGERVRHLEAAQSALSRPLVRVTVESLEELLPELLKLAEREGRADRELALSTITHGLLDYLARHPVPPEDANGRARLTRILTPAMQPLLTGLDHEAREIKSLCGIGLTRVFAAGADLSVLRPGLEERMQRQLLAFDPNAAAAEVGAPESDPRVGGRALRSSDPTTSQQVLGLVMTAALVQRAGGDMAPAIEMLHRTVDLIPEGRTARQSLLQLIALVESGEFMSPTSASSGASGSRSSDRGGFAGASSFAPPTDAVIQMMRDRGEPQEQIDAVVERLEQRRREQADRGR